MNINNVVGAIGFVSKIIPSVYPISIIKADPATGEPIRDSNGLCQVSEKLLRQHFETILNEFLIFDFVSVMRTEWTGRFRRKNYAE